MCADDDECKLQGADEFLDDFVRPLKMQKTVSRTKWWICIDPKAEK